MKINSKVLKMVDAYRATNRVAFVYPRKGFISLDGLMMPVADAVAKMKRVIEAA